MFIAAAQIGQFVECSGLVHAGQATRRAYLNADSITITNAGKRRPAFAELADAGADDDTDDVAV